MSSSEDTSSNQFAGQRLRFGTFEVDLEQRELRNGGIRVHLQRQPFQILELLLRRPGALVTRKELARHLWPGLHVSFGHGLNTAINVLRQTLGDSSAPSRFIETRPGFGYRFLADVEVVPEPKRAAGPKNTSASVAILPFENATGDPSISVEANRIAESVISRLALVEQIRVIAHTTTLRYRLSSDEPRTIGSELAVNAVLTGRIERIAESLLAIAELIDVTSGRRLWGDRYELTSGIPGIEATISAAVEKRLGSLQNVSEVVSLSKHKTYTTEAYQDYRRGKYLQNKLNGPDLGKSIAHFESAIAQDPKFAPAYAGLAATYSHFACLGLLSAAEARSKAESLIETALKIDDESPEAHAASGDLRMMFDWNYPAAEAAYRRALSLSPTSVDAHRSYAAFLSALGRQIEACDEIQAARNLDPLSLVLNAESARIRLMARQYQECINQAWETLVLEVNYAPAQHMLGLAYEQVEAYEEALIELENAHGASGDDPAVIASLGHAYGRSGQPDESDDMLGKLENLSRRQSVSPYWRSIVYAGQSAFDLALRALEEACRSRDVCLVWLKVEPRFDPLRADPRFDRLLEAVGLNQEQSMFGRP